MSDTTSRKLPEPLFDVQSLETDLAPKLAEELGLKLSEYDKIVDLLGRTPSLTELYMYSLMWSEHCSYKHSRKALRMFPNDGPHVLQGPGENAGVISVGEGWAVAFKMESHNHPSAIEPYQGAATGVGGIMRDIFTMGARPIASLNSLRFGSLEHPRQRYLFEGSVAGIGGYGNCLGIPTVGGEVYFDDAYEGNCLINAMGIGLMREENLTRAVGSGPGNLVVLIGSTTGRDGIGGASVLASQEFDEKAEDKRPAVQVGDPFEEKLLIEACLELLEAKLLVALGDLGAAGLTSSASEMASRGGVGLDIDVAKVPQREDEMKPFEIMVSESQERMLAVVTPEDRDAVFDICEKWGLRASVIGEVTDTGRFVVRENGVPVADMPADTLAEDAPIYDPLMQRPDYLDDVASFVPGAELDLLEESGQLNEALFELLASPNICSRRWIWEQYDHQVQSNTVVLPGADAAVVRIGEAGRAGGVTDRAIATSTDCNGRYCYLDPYVGAQIALAESLRNLACVGAEPAAITDCLNFGSPEKPEVFYTFHESVRGLADACRTFGVPVISGNVSFYNESFGNPIYPTPVVGSVGLVNDVHTVIGPAFSQEGDSIVLVGETLDELGGSEYLSVIHGTEAGAPPSLDLKKEMAVQDAVRDAVRSGLVNSAHDCSEGGLAVTLVESCIARGLGANVQTGSTLAPAARLFSESQSRIVVSADPAKRDELISLLKKYNVAYSVLGEVGSDRLVIDDLIDVEIDEAKAIYSGALAEHVGGN